MPRENRENANNRRSRGYQGELNNQFHEDQMDFGDNRFRNNERQNENTRYGEHGRNQRNDFGQRSGQRGGGQQNTRFSSADEYGANIGNDLISDRPASHGFHGKGPKGWKRSDDRIKEEVCESLYRDSEVDASGIEVQVKDSCVYLKGSVDSRDQKRAAERCVENLSGVEDVQNELRVSRTNSPSSGIQGSQTLS